MRFLLITILKSSSDRLEFIRELATYSQPFKRKSQKIVKHTQIFRRQQPTSCLSLFDNFVGLALKGLKLILPTGFYHGFAMSPYCLDQGNTIPMLAFRKSRTSSKFSLQTYHQHNWPSPNFPYYNIY